MGLKDLLTGRKRPKEGVEPVSADELRERLLAVNRESAPFVVRPGDDDRADLVAEWKIVDASWYEIFAKAGLEKMFKTLMRLDADKQEVRAVDQEWEIEWRAGTPVTSVAASAKRGRVYAKEYGRAWAFKEVTKFGEVYNYRFDSEEMKAPLRDAVLAAGWSWRPVAFAKL